MPHSRRFAFWKIPEEFLAKLWKCSSVIGLIQPTRLCGTGGRLVDILGLQKNPLSQCQIFKGKSQSQIYREFSHWVVSKLWVLSSCTMCNAEKFELWSSQPSDSTNALVIGYFSKVDLPYILHIHLTLKIFKLYYIGRMMGVTINNVSDPVGTTLF